MRLNFPPSSFLPAGARYAALFLCALGVFVLCGWAAGSEWMVRIVPHSPSMSINTAAMFFMAGVSILLMGSNSVSSNSGSKNGSNGGSANGNNSLAGNRLPALFSVLLVVLPLAILGQYMSGIALGIDWKDLHQSLGDGHAYPGRTAPNACVGFLLSGIVLMLAHRPALFKSAHRVTHALSIITFMIGLTAFLGHLLNLDTLYQIASYNKMAVMTALGMTALGIGLYEVQTRLKPSVHETSQHDAQNVAGLAAALLIVFALATGLAAFGFLKNSYERAATSNIWQTSKTTAVSISALLDKTILLSKSASRRPILKTALLTLADDPDNGRAHEWLQEEANSFIELGFSGVQIFDAGNRRLFSIGYLVSGQAKMAVPIDSVKGQGVLLWDDMFVFRSEYDIVHEDRIIGRIVTERQMAAFNEFMSQAQHVAQSSDVMLCGKDNGQIACFPSRLSQNSRHFPLKQADGKSGLPIVKALLGESGATMTNDLRGVPVLAGYVPIPEYRLALVEQIDTSELYAPLREKLPYLLGVIALCVIAGTSLLRRWVKPVVAQIANERRRAKAIINNSNDAFMAVNSAGVITDWNLQAERMLGWSAGAAIGVKLETLLGLDAQAKQDAATLRQLIEAVTPPVVSRRSELIIANHAGEAIPLEISVAPFNDGEEFAAGVFMRDLREVKQTEEELEKARAALTHSQKLDAVGKLTGGIAHDFNNVLQVIKGSLQLLQMENQDSFKVQNRIGTATNAVDKGAKLSSQLLAFARKQPLQPASTNLGRVVRDMNELLQRAIGESVEIETVVSGGLWNTMIDPNQLEHVILNLAINARDAMQGAGKLTIEVGNAMLEDSYVRYEPGLKAGQYVMLAITDTGTGMPPEIIERVFEPFFTTKREGEGTGLGLSMVYGFVKQSDGHIRIYSEMGHGTTIKIYLPRSHEKEAAAVATFSGEIEGGDERILVVEDDLSVQATATDMLTRLGYTVFRADNADMALEMLKGGLQIDLLFTDVVMPGNLRSPELAKEAQLLLPKLRVLFTSGYTQNAIVHGGRLDPGVHLLSKPYGQEQLARKVREMLCVNEKGIPVDSAELAIPAEEQQKHKQVPSRQTENRPGLSIAFVEDHDDFRLIAAEMMSMLGHRVESFIDAETALDRLSECRFDILLTDITLPGMSGPELGAAARRINPDIRVILASGFGDDTRGNVNYAYEVLPKPFMLEQLKKILDVKGRIVA